MTTEDDFQRQLDEHPDDFQTRLVFADWLDENGQPERAAFIRWQNDRESEQDDWGNESYLPRIIQPGGRRNPALLLRLLTVFYPWDQRTGGQFVSTADRKRERRLVCMASNSLRTMVFWHRGFVVGVYCDRISLVGRVHAALTNHPVRAVGFSWAPRFGDRAYVGEMAANQFNFDSGRMMTSDPNYLPWVKRYTVQTFPTVSSVVGDWYATGVLD